MTFSALFPGQLSEKAGMGEALAAAFPYVRTFFGEVARRTEVDLGAVFFGEGQPSLHDDLPAQVGVFAVSVAALDVLAGEHGLEPTACAGYSLGTYAAFVGAGVIGLPEAEVAAEVARLTADPREVSIGNVNAPQQVVLTGRREPVLRAIDHLSRHALKAEALPLAWPMHSPVLQPVTDQLASFVARHTRLAWPGRAALYAPMLGRLVRTEEEARQVLSTQISHASRWTDVLSAMAAAGETRFAEVGPGDVLSKMHRWTLRRSRAEVLEEPVGIARFAADLGAAAPAAAPSAADRQETT